MMTDHRYFNTGDTVTDHNLTRLDHLSRQTTRDGEVHLFEILIRATIQSLEMLPQAVRKHFGQVYSYVGAYDRQSAAWRMATWTKLAAGLDEGLTAALTDSALARGGGADLKDRPRSQGERLEAACEAFLDALSTGRSLEGPLREIEGAASGTEAQGDAQGLKRLLNRARVVDFKGQATRLAWHAREIAHNLHHLK